MDTGEFKFETCLLKHYVRREVWLPHAKRRRKRVQESAPQRRFKYLTLCAIGALDVLMLHKRKVLTLSKEDQFDTVYFFNRSPIGIVETRKRIPGAKGFQADLVDVLLPDEDGDGEDDIGDTEEPENKQDDIGTREKERTTLVRNSFKQAFPFDLVNLDLEEYLFKAREQVPGRLVQALARLFELQKRKGLVSDKKPYEVDEFTLMFTTRVGPAEGLTSDYIAYLRDHCLQKNLDRFPELVEPFKKRAQGRDVPSFFDQDFDEAFKIAAPKSIVELAWEHDWHIVGSEAGVEIFQFHREQAVGNPYTILHMAMTLRRPTPKKGQRLPGTGVPQEAQNEHNEAIRRLFAEPPIQVEPLVEGENAAALQADLDEIIQHREKIMKRQA